MPHHLPTGGTLGQPAARSLCFTRFQLLSRDPVPVPAASPGPPAASAWSVSEAQVPRASPLPSQEPCVAHMSPARGRLAGTSGPSAL